MTSHQWPGADPRMAAAPPTVITLCPDGPLLVRGPIRIVDAAGAPVDPGRATIALCRCGATRTPPFCDGTHKLRRTVRTGPREHPAGEPVEESPSGMPDPTSRATGDADQRGRAGEQDAKSGCDMTADEQANRGLRPASLDRRRI